MTTHSGRAGSGLGIDVGGSGSRIALTDLPASPATAPSGGREVLSGPRVQVSAEGSSVPQLVGQLVESAYRTWPEQMDAVGGIGIGATGIASLVADPAALASQLTARTGIPVAVAADAVTAHLGALGGQGGAIVVLGTGAIAVGHPGPDPSGVFPPRWRRVDGWGHLLGDRGGGAWLGRLGLELAVRAYDGVPPAGDTPDGQQLLEVAVRRFGPPASWPSQLYTRQDRAGVLGEFARDVVDLACAGDPASAELVARAGTEAARSALAALEEDHPAQVVLTGGLARAEGGLSEAFSAQIAAHSPLVMERKAAGDPLDGALRLAQLAAAGCLRAQEGTLWL
ncbi:hypothetical protein M3B43_10700 [Nesterenkonia massiliensis]|uniref:ATPase BadF/BadG/BcrA/BcrD type domain-containing protein n=1 Tax=Nesterenkonia massiliensis TaxID=1232429 RepID=A0ABT2HSV5_9MICC|nr:hypothetical protein [Nesterenkonia massiliensis]